MNKSVDLGGRMLRESIDQKNYDSETFSHRQKNLYIGSFDPQTLYPQLSLQYGRDINQMTSIPVAIGPELRNDFHLLDDRLILPNSVGSSAASKTLNDLQSRAQSILGIPEFARSQGINYDKNKPNLCSKQPRISSSDSRKHSEVGVLQSLQHVAQKYKCRMPNSSELQKNVNESYRKRKNGDFCQSEKKIGQGRELVNIGHVQSNSGGAHKCSDQYHATGKNGKNVMQYNYSGKVENTKARTPERENKLSLDTKYIANEHEAVNEIGTKLESSFERDLMKLLDLGAPFIQLDLVKEFELRAKLLNRKQTAFSILQNLGLVKDQIKKHGGTDFFVTDAEVLNFLGYPAQRNFVINYSNSENLRASSALKYTSELKIQLQLTDFSSSAAFGVNPLIFHHIKEWKKLQSGLEKHQLKMSLGKKSMTGKLFLVYSIIINKIFCNGPQDSAFIERQAEALEFYHSIFGVIEANHNGPNKIHKNGDKYDLIRSENNKAVFDSLVKGLKNKFMSKASNQSRQQFWMAWMMVELWLVQSRKELYQSLRNKNKKLADNFKPFINNIVYTLLELNKL
ncbi:hypothetical protein BY996DRAFT_6865543 [Phakopsora pachyrhizi]|nr:hypothetical protein BY996DRAFT_6865543 [Phakopsora pachyrhizi]